jgi:hypothetical protein
MKTKMMSFVSNRHAILALSLLWLLPLLLSAVPIVSFNVTDLESYNSSANWVFDYDSPGTPTHDMNPYTFSPMVGYPAHNFAHKYVHAGVGTTSPCIGENIAFVGDFNDITISYGEFELVAYEKINTVDPTLPWSNTGQAGDRRTYSNATATVFVSGIPKLVLSNVTFVIDTPYPTQVQIRAAGLTGWIGDLGTGLPQTGYGYADIDIVASDPAWVNLFSTTDNKMDLQLDTIVYFFNPVNQNGYFDFVLGLLPVAVPYTTGVELIGPANLNPSFPTQNLDFSFASYTPGGENSDETDVFVREILATPSGTLPGGINFVANKYWELGTTLNSLSTSITFTIGSGDFAKAPTDWRILKREYNGAPWAIWADYTLVDPTHIRANNVSSFSEFTIGSNVDETLPVELSSFNAILTSDLLVNLSWVTESETQLVGYNVYRAETNTAANAVRVNPSLIAAANTSAQHSYTLTDSDVNVNTTYYYWLESVEMSGDNAIYGPQSVTVTGNNTPPVTEISQLNSAYPNPFHSGTNTRINVSVKTGETGMVTIYNILGQNVKSFPVTAGIHNLNWDGKGAGSGLYFVKLSTPSTNITKKLVMLR